MKPKLTMEEAEKILERLDEENHPDRGNKKAPVLSEEEIDLLLSAISEETVTVEFDGQPVVKNLSLFDFSKKDLLSYDQLREVDRIHEALGRRLEQWLIANLSVPVKVEYDSSSLATFSEHRNCLPRTCAVAEISFGTTRELSLWTFDINCGFLRSLPPIPEHGCHRGAGGALAG